jgi:predicted flap endonuclease-1-like 5' DNA nuclease
MNKNKIIKNGRESDDLKRIRGIEPRLEQRLNEIGITTYSQIAKFNEVEIYFVCQNIGLDPNRITRDNWVKNARELLNLNKKLNCLA